MSAPDEPARQDDTGLFNGCSVKYVMALLFGTVLLFVFAALSRQIWTGVIKFSGGSAIRRDEKPLVFWLLISLEALPTLYLVIGFALLRLGFL